ncbi:MAG: class I SAM-dependent methyltransferase [Clostridia bacterium]|nr:class I SAM-dependent methyltransferase [Clostridia bacterium]
MSAYGAFADLYDALMDDVDYDGWADWYLKLLRDAGVEPAKLCDCACGTGSMSVRFARRGIRVTGADLSGEMLARAQEKARRFGVQVMFVEQDMCALTLPRPVDALVCACDGVNYLLTGERVARFFERAHEALRPGGALAFDFSTEKKLRETLGNGLFGEDRDDVTYLWANRYDENDKTATMDLTFFVREADGRYRRFDETHVQKAHDPDRLEALLAQYGFTRVRVYGDRTLDAPDANAQRIHMTAVRL